jgi:hypothetical protein
MEKMSMSDEKPIRPLSDTAATEPKAPEPCADDKPTECGLTRQELRAIVEEIIG